MHDCSTHVLKFRRGLELHTWRSAVSLHSHTMHSREYLGRLPEYISRIPVASYLIEREVGRVHLYRHCVVDFRRIYWTPPLSAREAYRLEAGQIEQQLGLAPLVSLSDHDNIEAGLHLSMLQETSHVPVSVEWSAPYEGTVFHLGVHNLPACKANSWMEQFRRYTGKPNRKKLRCLLHELNSDPSLLLILNHPFWSAEGVAPAVHRASLAAFLEEYRSSLHALELNGLRSRKENHDVVVLARELDLPVISGGDRHGCEPNAVVNLTAARNFSEFVQEIRVDRRSQVLLMPQFFDTLQLRLLESAWHALSDAPGEFGRRHWISRVFVEMDDGESRPLSRLTGPRFHHFVDKFRFIMALLASPQMRPALRLAFLGTEESGL
jgi:hypothetical protein